MDLLYYPNPIIQQIELHENIRMYAIEDIAAMKIQAILGRGKKKDFWDVAEILQRYTLKEIIFFYQNKYLS